MRTLYGMLLRTFLPVFAVTLFFFVLIFQLMDVFSNIQRYVNKDVSVVDIGLIAFYYIPKCISYSIPIGFLFSITFTLGIFYSNNELIAIFGSGVSLYRLVMPFLVIGMLLCVGVFFFEEEIVIDTFIKKNNIYKKVLELPEPFSNYNVTVKTADNRIIYQVNYYNDVQKSLSQITILERDAQDIFLRRIDAETASWNGKNWVLNSCRIFKWNHDMTRFLEESQAVIDDPVFSEKPELFQRDTRKIEELNYRDAFDWVTALMKSGRPYQEAESEFYKKFSFALTPLIVALISCTIGGILRKNILLMSLLFSLCIVVVYYVIQMITMTMASSGYIPPFWGAWSATLLFLIVGIGLFRLART